MKGILLAGGSGKRLDPLTRVVSKQLLPVYDKPLIYYPLSTLIRAGARDILIVSTPRDTPLLEALLGKGSQFGVYLSYAIQPEPKGIAQALIIGEDFLAGEPCFFILGDNIFHGGNLQVLLDDASTSRTSAHCFVTEVPDPSAFGVVVLNGRKVHTIVEKPKNPKSNIVATGLYLFNGSASKIAKRLEPSERGELEITGVCQAYCSQNMLYASVMHCVTWFDAGSFDSLLRASNFVMRTKASEKESVGCPYVAARHVGCLA